MLQHKQLYAPQPTPNWFFLCRWKTVCLFDYMWHSTDYLSNTHQQRTYASTPSNLPTHAEMVLLGSHAGRGAEVPPYTFSMHFPRIKDFYFTGTGDLLAALLLAWLRKFPDEPHKAAEVAIATVQAVIRRTKASSEGNKGARTSELRLIQSIRDIENPDASRISAVCKPTVASL